MADTAEAPLTGKALLQKVKELDHLSRREKARHCGYFMQKNGEVQVDVSGFYDAVIAAKLGFSLDPGAHKDGRGRDATYRVTVHKNGQIVIGAAYTKEMGLKPGDEFIIKLGYKHIQLVKVEPGE
jgi:AbrB family looped-hinge helix DNA binding protein